MGKNFKEAIKYLVKMHSSPPEIALGVAIGVFIAITPLYGFHTIMVIIAAILVRRCNKIAILLGTNISIPPTLPFITWAGYEIGRFMLGKDYPDLNWEYFRGFSLKKVADMYLPLFLGSIVLGIICGVVFYFFTLALIRIIRKRRARIRVSA